jgi:hypothetical protein
MAGNFVRASVQHLIANSLSAINNGTLTIAIKSSNSVLQTFFCGDSGSSTNYNQAVWGGNFTGAYADESIGWQTITSGSPVLTMVVRNGTSFYQDGTWHKFAFRIDGSANQIFVDGTKPTVSFANGSSTTSNVFIPYATRVEIARFVASATNLLDGQIDDLRIYNVGLNDSECLAITSGNGNDAIVRGLQMHLRMDEASAGQTITIANDISGNNINGTGANSPTYIGSPIRILR